MLRPRSLLDLLQQALDLGIRLLDARFASLGLLDEPGTAFEHFLAAGTDGALPSPPPDPRGRGILGLLIRDPRPLRLDDAAEDPASLGLPGRLPPVVTCLGMPITSRGKVRGTLCFAEKKAGPGFRLPDERLAESLARLAADILEDVAPRTEILRSLELFRGVLEPGAAVITTPAPVREVLYWNKGAEELFGFTAEEALGRRLPDLNVPMEEREYWRKHIQPGLMLRLQEGRDAPFEAFRLHKSGERIRVRVVMSPIRHEVAGIMAVTRVYKYRRVQPEDIQNPVPGSDLF